MRERTWPNPTSILNRIFASIVPIDPCGILASVSENILRKEVRIADMSDRYR